MFQTGHWNCLQNIGEPEVGIGLVISKRAWPNKGRNRAGEGFGDMRA
jgi:hypothetical protein